MLQSERTLKDAGDKVSADVKGPVQEKIDALKKLLESKDYYGAHRSYSDAKKLYASLSENSKLEHYNGLIELYSRLEHFYNAHLAY